MDFKKAPAIAIALEHVFGVTPASDCVIDFVCWSNERQWAYVVAK